MLPALPTQTLQSLMRPAAKPGITIPVANPIAASTAGRLTRFGGVTGGCNTRYDIRCNIRCDIRSTTRCRGPHCWFARRLTQCIAPGSGSEGARGGPQ